MSKIYNLSNNWVIGEDKDRLWWLTYFEGDPEENGLACLSGKCMIKNGVLMLSRWKSIGPAEEGETLDGYYKQLTELPKWNRTKYFVKDDDLFTAQIYYCESGDVVPDDEANEIMTKLGYSREKN